jgi:lipopolysaccharide exporter
MSMPVQRALWAASAEDAVAKSNSGDWGRRTRGGIIWSNATFVGTKLVSSLSLVVLARLLTPSDFGVVAAILVYVTVVELISDIGMRATVIYEQEDAVTDRVQTAFTINVLLALLLTAIGVALAPVVAGFFHAQAHTDLFRLAAINPFVKGLGNIHDGLLLRGLEFNRRIVSQVVMSAVRAGVSIPLALLGFGAWSLIIGLLAGSLAWTLVLWAQTRFVPKFTLDRSAVRSMTAYGTAASAIDIVASISTRVDAIVIARVLGDRALGLYTVAFRVPELLIESVAWNTAVVAFPALSLKRRDDPDSLADATRSLVRYQSLYAIPVGVWLALVGPPLVVVLFGSAWRAAGGVTSAVAVMSAITAVAFPLGDVFKALGKQRIFLGIQLIQLPFYVAAIILVAPAGIVAVAWARAATRAGHSLFLSLVVCRTLGTKLRTFVAATGPALAAGLGVFVGTGAVRLLWSELSIGPLVAATAAGAVGGLVALRLLDPAAFREVREIGVGLFERRAKAPASAASPV